MIEELIELIGDPSAKDVIDFVKTAIKLRNAYKTHFGYWSWRHYFGKKRDDPN